MGSNHSVAIGNEDTPCAMVVYQEKGEGTIAHSKDEIESIFPLVKLPTELQNKIIGYCMTATDHEIKFPCLTNADYKPNVNTGLLLTNHRIYHEAHYQLRTQNTFVFNHFGSDLKTIASSVGPFKCRSGACGYGALRSSLAKVVFYLGDEDLPDLGADKTHAFGCALRYLHSEITVESLYMNLAMHTFRHSAELSWFAAGLKNIKVQDKFTVVGDEKFLDMCFGDLPITLGMALMPVHSYFLPYNPFIRYNPGWFTHRYVPEEHAGKEAISQHQDLASRKVVQEAAATCGEPLPGRLWPHLDDFGADY